MASGPIVGVRSEAEPGTIKRKQARKPKQPLAELHEGLTGVLQTTLATLRRKDERRIIETGKRAYWIVESAQDFAGWMRPQLQKLAGKPLRTVDFKDMYTNIPHTELLRRVEESKESQWEFHPRHS